MEADHVAGGEEFFARRYGLHSGGFDGFGGAEGVVGLDVHAESLGDAGHVAAYVAESEQTEGLALEFGARLAVVEVAHGIDEQAHHEFGHGVGVLARRVHGHHVVSRGGGQVDVVVTGTGAYDDFQLLGGGKDGLVHLVGADDEGVGVGHGVEQLLLFSVFLQECQLGAGLFHHFADAADGDGGEGFFGCNKYFHM